MRGGQVSNSGVCLMRLRFVLSLALLFGLVSLARTTDQPAKVPVAKDPPAKAPDAPGAER